MKKRYNQFTIAPFLIAINDITDYHPTPNIDNITQPMIEPCIIFF